MKLIFRVPDKATRRSFRYELWAVSLILGGTIIPNIYKSSLTTLQYILWIVGAILAMVAIYLSIYFITKTYRDYKKIAIGPVMGILIILSVLAYHLYQLFAAGVL